MVKQIADSMLWAILLSSWLWLTVSVPSASGASHSSFTALPIPVPVALLTAHQEAPEQFLYKAFQTFKDQNGRKWRAIAFNHTFPDGRHDFQLRLVGFPGVATVDRDRPLQLKTALGRTFMADDTAQALFKTGETAESYVAQYDLQPIVAQLPNLIPIRLFLPIEGGPDLRLLVGPGATKEWQAVALGNGAAIAWSEQ
ncbi:MAG: DUF3122 domain-containing protein [Leptolyngbyaceae cyanobacterium]